MTNREALLPFVLKSNCSQLQKYTFDRKTFRNLPCIHIFCSHVYLTDWGSEAAVVRTKLDGSNDTTIVNQLKNPNGVHYRAGKRKHNSVTRGFSYLN